MPAICSCLLKKGFKVKWYIIGFGGDEELIRQKIAEERMEEYVILLGKKRIHIRILKHVTCMCSQAGTKEKALQSEKHRCLQSRL